MIAHAVPGARVDNSTGPGGGGAAVRLNSVVAGDRGTGRASGKNRGDSWRLWQALQTTSAKPLRVFWNHQNPPHATSMLMAR